MIHGRLCLYEFIRDERLKKWIYLTFRGCSCPAMQQKRWQKSCSRLNGASLNFFTFLAAKCCYTLFHGYSLPCRHILKSCPIRGPWGIQPTSHLNLVMACCVAGKTELPSIILYQRLRRGQLCCHKIKLSNLNFHLMRTWPFWALSLTCDR